MDVAELDDPDYDEEDFDENGEEQDDEDQHELRPLDIDRDHLPYQEPLPKTGMSNLFDCISEYSDRMDFNVSTIRCLKDVDRFE